MENKGCLEIFENDQGQWFAQIRCNGDLTVQRDFDSSEKAIEWLGAQAVAYKGSGGINGWATPTNLDGRRFGNLYLAQIEIETVERQRDAVAITVKDLRRMLADYDGSLAVCNGQSGLLLTGVDIPPGPKGFLGFWF